MTFDEWYNISKGLMGFPSVKTAEGIFTLARQGMIPEDGAILVPKVEEWPENTEGEMATAFVVCGWYSWHTTQEAQSKYLNKGIDEKIIAWIPRPTPAWTPKVGEPVFFLENNTVMVGIVANNDAEKGILRLNCGGVAFWGGALDVKPFNPDYIGKPWDEIVPF